MASINNTPRPAYVYDTATNEWIPIGVGAHSHNEIPKTVVDAKGDLIVGTAADEVNRLAVGTSGNILASDSSTSTGLAYVPSFFAGKNKIINGDFNINQRGFSSTTTSASYGLDRWRYEYSGGTCTYSVQTFTPGAAPVTGYEAANFARVVTASQSATGHYCAFAQRIEDVRTFAGQTVTVSFWAKTASGTPKVSVEMIQTFGSGGSSDVNTQASSAFTLSTGWTRYSTTINMPAIQGKTIGTGGFISLFIWVSGGSDYASRNNSIGIQNNTFDFWGVQLESGSTATQFQTATGTIQGELAACQRYYYQMVSGDVKSIGTGAYVSATEVYCGVFFPVTMRTAPTLSATSGTNYYISVVNNGNDFLNSLTADRISTNTSWLLNSSEASSTIGYASILRTANASASIAFSAEL